MTVVYSNSGSDGGRLRAEHRQDVMEMHKHAVVHCTQFSEPTARTSV